MCFCLYGKQLVQENELETDTKDTMFKADGELHEQERDVSKIWKNGEIRNGLLQSLYMNVLMFQKN